MTHEPRAQRDRPQPARTRHRVGHDQRSARRRGAHRREHRRDSSPHSSSPRLPSRSSAAPNASAPTTQVSASAWRSSRASPRHTTEPSPSPREPRAGSASPCNYPPRHRTPASTGDGSNADVQLAPRRARFFVTRLISRARCCDQPLWRPGGAGDDGGSGPGSGPTRGSDRCPCSRRQPGRCRQPCRRHLGDPASAGDHWIRLLRGHRLRRSERQRMASRRRGLRSRPLPREQTGHLRRVPSGRSRDDRPQAGESLARRGGRSSARGRNGAHSDQPSPLLSSPANAC